jgi:hypothetical protein
MSCAQHEKSKKRYLGTVRKPVWNNDILKNNLTHFSFLRGENASYTEKDLPITRFLRPQGETRPLRIA